MLTQVTEMILVIEWLRSIEWLRCFGEPRWVQCHGGFIWLRNLECSRTIAQVAHMALMAWTALGACMAYAI